MSHRCQIEGFDGVVSLVDELGERLGKWSHHRCDGCYQTSENATITMMVMMMVMMMAMMMVMMMAARRPRSKRR